MTKVRQLTVAKSPGKADMLRLLDHIRQGVESGEIIGLMTTLIGSDMKFDNYSCGDISAATRIGYLMCHVDDLMRSMRS